MTKSNRSKLIRLLGEMTTNDYNSKEEFAMAYDLFNYLKPVSKPRKKRATKFPSTSQLTLQ